MYKTIQGYFDGENIIPSEYPPLEKECRVLITFLEEDLLSEELTPEQMERLEESIQQAKDGKTVPHEEVMEMMKQWIKKS
jgi:hypothetical protein